MENSNYIKEIEKIQTLIKQSETLEVRASERRKSLRPQYQKKVEEIKALGLDIEHIEEDILKKEKEIELKIKEALSLIPVDIVKKYKDYDFAGASEEKPNLNQPF